MSKAALRTASPPKSCFSDAYHLKLVACARLLPRHLTRPHLLMGSLNARSSMRKCLHLKMLRAWQKSAFYRCYANIFIVRNDGDRHSLSQWRKPFGLRAPRLMSNPKRWPGHAIRNPTAFIQNAWVRGNAHRSTVDSTFCALMCIVVRLFGKARSIAEGGTRNDTDPRFTFASAPRPATFKVPSFFDFYPAPRSFSDAGANDMQHTE